jgi:CRP-like cAMP-binding protein
MFLNLLPGKKERKSFKEEKATDTGLGRFYQDGALIIKQGDPGNCMYVIRSGKVDVIIEENGQETNLTTLQEGDFFGEMSLFEKEKRSTSVKARGQVQIITIDKKTLLKRIKEDPTLAFRLLEKMSLRLRELNQKISNQYQVD